MQTTLTLSEVKDILQTRRMRPLRQLGQNFLIDANLCRAIVDALPAPTAAAVLEIGPGLGALTRLMLDRGWNVTALELDKGISQYLAETFAGLSHFKLVTGDALKTLSLQPFHEWIIGNLPYNVSTQLMVEILKFSTLPQACVFTVQKEMAERIAAEPKTKSYGAVSVFVQTFYEIEMVRKLKGQVFYPEPEVDSIIIRWILRKDIPTFDREHYYAFLRKGFSQRRKMLRSIYPQAPQNVRAEELSVGDWKKFYRTDARIPRGSTAGMNCAKTFFKFSQNELPLRE